MSLLEKQSEESPWDIHGRLWASVELILLVCLFFATVWGPFYWGATGWFLATGLLFFLTIVLSLVVRRPGWKASGFRLDNLVPAMKCVGWVTLLGASALLLCGYAAGIRWNSMSASLVLGRLFGAMLQEALFLGYFFLRWQAIIPSPGMAAVANSLLFAMCHVPDPGLVLVAGSGGFLFNWLFLRERNVFVIGLSHGLLSLLALPLLIKLGLMAMADIGPPVLGTMSGRVAEELRRGARIGHCSRAIAYDRLGSKLTAATERVLRGQREGAEIREKLRRFLGSDDKAICVITEREYRSYLDDAERKRLFVLDERYIWNVGSKPLKFAQNDPLWGWFRDRVLLVSNRPAS